ncbi:hypothetical protein ADUPG1_008161 [Aduncisulcus paluster]|uniref:Uncharacterized protein n=1 Tax=Aduncisulcus paluster TaxID=2918883 RepID=A0ABQ5KQX8_9EUKA|nr:hypothetical protein ADUPG1_008161 [Aduncisulcus paluster]
MSIDPAIFVKKVSFFTQSPPFPIEHKNVIPFDKSKCHGEYASEFWSDSRMIKFIEDADTLAFNSLHFSFFHPSHIDYFLICVFGYESAPHFIKFILNTESGDNIEKSFEVPLVESRSFKWFKLPISVSEVSSFDILATESWFDTEECELYGIRSVITDNMIIQQDILRETMKKRREEQAKLEKYHSDERLRLAPILEPMVTRNERLFDTHEKRIKELETTVEELKSTLKMEREAHELESKEFSRSIETLRESLEQKISMVETLAQTLEKRLSTLPIQDSIE